MNTGEQARTDVMLDDYLAFNRSVTDAMKNGCKIPAEQFQQMTDLGQRVFVLHKSRKAKHSSVFDYLEGRIDELKNAVKPYMQRQDSAGPKIKQQYMADAEPAQMPAVPKWKRMLDASHVRHPCGNHPDMVRLHNATDTWDMNLDKLPVKKETITANGVPFKEHDISKLCNCQAFDVWQMQRVEYMAACQEAGKEIPSAFRPNGEPVE